MDRKRKILILMIFAAIVLLFTAEAHKAQRSVCERYAQTFSPQQVTLVIDPGHGGFDGGAVSEDGTRESDINLAVALRLECIVRFLGQKTMMTRWDDSRKTDIITYSEREDLKYRAGVANSIGNAVLLSIHQNDYPTAQPKGAQVLYSGFGSSKRLGELIQEGLVTQLDPANRRLAIPASKELYLTSRTRCPAVIVECGFMSNNFEVLKLKEEAYQIKLAAVIAAAYLQYLSGESRI